MDRITKMIQFILPRSHCQKKTIYSFSRLKLIQNRIELNIRLDASDVTVCVCVSTRENLVIFVRVLVFDKERVTSYRDVEFLPMNVTFGGISVL